MFACSNQVAFDHLFVAVCVQRHATQQIKPEIEDDTPGLGPPKELLKN